MKRRRSATLSPAWTTADSRASGERHPDSLIARSNVAASLTELGRFDEAEALVRSTLEIRRSVLGPSHPLVAREMATLGTLLFRQGRAAEAEQVLSEALRICRDRYGEDPGGLTLQSFRDAPHGIDQGPMVPRIREIIATPNGRIDLAPEIILADLPRIAARIARATDGLLLTSRRHLRSNNSWMHNIHVLVKGKPRCTLHVHPDDAAELGLVDGGYAKVTSRVGSVEAPVEVTEDIRPGVVSLPHGWGHGVEGTRLRVAAERAGVNSNVLSDHRAFDPLSGTSVLNGIPVSIEPTASID